MPTISTRCAVTRPSSWPADGCRRVALIWPRNRRSRGWRMPLTCAPCCGWDMRWVFFGGAGLSPARPRRPARPPRAITLDIDDTLDVVHGHQPPSLFNAHYDERCFLPIHVYEAESGHCVAAILRPGKTPDGREVRGHLRRLTRRIRSHWPETRITVRGDSHYGRPEAMAWCEANGVSYLFGLSTNKVLATRVEPAADAVRVRRAVNDLDRVREHIEFPYAAASWPQPRRVVARIEATRRGLDVRYVVTNLTHCPPHWLYASLYCARGQAENLIKRHKSQLASDRTSCRSPLANQMRLILHTAAYWLMRVIAHAIPKPQPLAC